jgi:TolB-like protein/Flp pilus assembly protein TadD
MVSLARIRERKLFQWAVAYLAGAWLVLQLVGLLSQPFGWPPAVLRGTTVVLGIGLFAALVLAWYHGEKGRQMVGGIEIIMLAGILLIAGLGVWLVGGARVVTPPAEGFEGGFDAATMSDEAVAEQGSVAVLPFVNMSSDPEQEYFSDGLTEELLNVLAQVPELRVAARTSAFRFKGTNVPIDSIGRALRVGHVVEGSVRKAGDRVRITAQLIDARTGFHIWSDTYDRDLRDVFAVQDEISRAILDQLRVQLTSGTRLARQETSDPQAHALVLQGLAISRSGSVGSFELAASAFRKALERDPDYARAHALLGGALMMQAYFRTMPMEEGYREARASAERSLELDPDLAEGHAVLARLADVRDWDFVEADRRYRLALASNPSDARARSIYAWLLMRLGRTEEALREAVRATEIDPLSMPAYNNLGVMYSYSHQPELAVMAFRKAIALAPGAFTTFANLALTYSDLGRHGEAIEAAEKAWTAGRSEPFSAATAAYVYGVAGRPDDAERALAELEAITDVSLYLLATAHAGLGNREEVFELLERAVEQRDDYVLDLGVDPVFDRFRDDPRMARLLRKMGLE